MCVFVAWSLCALLGSESVAGVGGAMRRFVRTCVSKYVCANMCVHMCVHACVCVCVCECECV